MSRLDWQYVERLMRQVSAPMLKALIDEMENPAPKHTPFCHLERIADGLVEDGESVGAARFKDLAKEIIREKDKEV